MGQQTKYRSRGDIVVHRGVYKQKVWYARPATVVEDDETWTKLLLLPGSVCQFPAGLIERKYSESPKDNCLNRWDEQASDHWEKVERLWQTNRFLILNQPNKYYSISLIWNDESNKFICWYVNFELPLTRNSIGFDTLDLEIDLVVKPDLSFEWKDGEEYADGVNRGIITADQVQQIELAKVEVLDKIANKEYPFNDHTLIDWRPPKSWEPPQLIEGWDIVNVLE